MANTYVNLGARTDVGSGTSTIAYPASIASGDLLIVFAGIKPNSAILNPPTSTLTWTEVATNSVQNDQKIWTATYDGSATAPTINTGGNRTYASMAAIRGQASSSLDAFASASTSPATDMIYPALTIANDNEIIFTFCLDKGNITSVLNTSGFTEIEDYNSGASGYSFQIQYQIQTSKTNITQGTPTVTGGGSVTQRGLTIAFIAANVGGSLLTQESNYGGF